MKKLITYIAIVIFLAAGPLLMQAQTPPHPNGGGAPGSGNTPVGGGAPIGGGLIIMLALGIGYSAKRIFDSRSRLVE
ncbi:MAG: hypothetical protein DRJ05_12335 [Bacteroidetes bacterium]|nr:MAG: hypothetical protein DRJ05_12335 [Bacteroidota bacterium]